MKKLIKSQKESREKILNAINTITEPVVQTLSPWGSNVMFQDAQGRINLTNDGVTIARQIDSDDPIESAIIEVIKHGALKTNRIAGDGTTTTTLLTSILIKEGLKMIDDGVNPMQLKKDIQSNAESIAGSLSPVTVEDDDKLLNIARISANNDEEIAQHVLDVVKTAGEDGIVIIDESHKDDTELEKNSGFIIEGGIFSPEYAQGQGFTTNFQDCHVLVCDKRIYYEEEAETIIRTAIESGIQKLVIVARDFIGKSVNVFAHNQANNEDIEMLLVKDPNAGDASYSLSDLALYLDGKLITDKHGKLVNSLESTDFCEAERVFANPHRTVITTKTHSKELDERIESLRKEKEETGKEDKEINRRLAALTNGMVTVKVGGSTPIEVQEKIFRYEDAINATRSAMTDGYLVGGGLGILGAYNESISEPYRPMFRKMCEASVRQIAKNCGQHEDYVLSQCKPYVGFGYNAKTGTFENLDEAGVIDPYKVTQMAIKNAASIAGIVLTSQYIIVNDKDKDEDGK